MSNPVPPGEITILLNKLRKVTNGELLKGRSEALRKEDFQGLSEEEFEELRRDFDELVRLTYNDVHRRAQQIFNRENAGHLLQPTALANEAYLRLMKMKCWKLTNREHFYNAIATIMRNVLVDYARRAHGVQYVELPANFEPALDIDPTDGVDAAELLIIDKQLTVLMATEPRASRFFFLNWFGGMPMKEIAEAYGLAEKTIQRDIKFAKKYLAQKIRAERSKLQP